MYTVEEEKEKALKDLREIQGDRFERQSRAGELVINYLYASIKAFDEDKYGVLVTQERKDALIANQARAFIAAYDEFCDEIRK